ncbi:ER to Golgi transport-related protein [Pseudozyma hubeiensis SY62]|uniref:ER to Golgi transport-related protein n=1 Tax=Pseudozyma hubeiensis (strain SY62) TaxID=1305764 RepID=R9PAP1_PSEHS|nr:ER to Golgi transport-related protein [Pseudozyma hubeiensis SY62]GAC98463.1 ER to Golgi transport-related protein [Pseudozyma hubeiensis SY62]
MTADTVASTSGAGEGSARKRIRKRSKKSKSKNADAGVQADESSDEEHAPTPVTTPAETASVTSSKAKQPTNFTAMPSTNTKPPVASSSSTKPSNLTQVNPHKPSFITRPATTNGRKFTVSVAIPGSIVLNAQSPELQSRLAAHIARACAIFNVDEIVVFDEGEVRSEAGTDLYQHRHNQQNRGTKRRYNAPQGNPNGGEGEQAHEEAEGGGGEEGVGKGFDPHTFLARVLQYLETPQYLRKALFPMHRDLRLAGLMPPLDCPHHLRFEDQSEYREGVTVEPPHWARRGGQDSVYVNVGLRDVIEAYLPEGARVESGTRVTVKMPMDAYGAGEIVSPREPVEQLGWYWGYTVRLAGSLSSVLTGCPFGGEGGYDLVIGTSERGVSLTDLTLATTNGTPVALPSGETVQPLSEEFNHALLVFGGLSGLEVAVEQDTGIKLDRHTARDLFDAWINVVENQGSRTVRTEEAIMIALARVTPLLQEVADKTRR